VTVRVRRFFYVRSPKGRVLHIQFGKSHTVACGRNSEKGWSWMNRGNIPVCKRCLKA